MTVRDGVFWTLWVTIVAISAYDTCWTVANREVMANVERNPVGRLLISLHGDDIWLLVLVKAAGTVVAAALLLVLYWIWPRLGWPACLGVAAFQLWLVAYLQS